MSTDDAARAAALEFAQSIAAYWRRVLADDVIGFYLIGSLAHGGFNRRYSDIDVALVTEAGIDDDALDAMRMKAIRLAPELAPKLSLFWSDRGFTMGRFPPLDRIDYLKHGVPLYERERVVPVLPTLAEVRRYLAGRPFATWAERACAFATAERLDPAHHKPYLRAHLYPARFAFSWMTGDIGSNDAAVDFISQDPPPGLDIGTIERALSCRHRAADPDDLFPARGILPGQVSALKRMIGRPS